MGDFVSVHQVQLKKEGISISNKQSSKDLAGNHLAAGLYTYLRSGTL